jgi:predicted GH43/DUF377 family glycosyl hydrolase
MRTFSASAALLLSAAVVFHCDRGTKVDSRPLSNSKGSVVLKLGKKTLPDDVRVVIATLERSTYRPLVDSVVVMEVVDTVKLRFDNIPAGAWILAVEARDSLEIVRYSGSTKMTVAEGRTTQATVYMTPTVGGNLEITLVWPVPRLKWKMSPENPVLQQSIGGWDANHFFFHDPSVVRINGEYNIWYSAGYSLSVNSVETLWVAHATSLDGIHWSKDGPAIRPGAPGSWMEKGAHNPSVIYEDGIYRMWFEGESNVAYHNGIGYATSTDGRLWIVNYQPVVPTSTSKPAIWHPCVVRKGGIYFAYFGVSSSYKVSPKDIYLMTSTDGVNWSDQGIVLSSRPNLSWESTGIVAPQVLVDDNRFIMFYTGLSPNRAALGYAESSDGTNWVQMGDTPTLSTSDTYPWVTMWVGYCGALREDGKLKLWFSGLSPQPYRWQIGYAEQIQ